MNDYIHVSLPKYPLFSLFIYIDLFDFLLDGRLNPISR